MELVSWFRGMKSHQVTTASQNCQGLEVGGPEPPIALFQDGCRCLCDKCRHVGMLAYEVARAWPAIVPSRSPSRGGDYTCQPEPERSWQRARVGSARRRRRRWRRQFGRGPGRQSGGGGGGCGTGPGLEHHAAGRPGAGAGDRVGGGRSAGGAGRRGRGRGRGARAPLAGGAAQGRGPGTTPRGRRGRRPRSPAASARAAPGPAQAGGAGPVPAREAPEPGLRAELRPAAAGHGGQLQGEDLAGRAEDQPSPAQVEGGMTEMVRKITLSRAVRIMQNLFPEEYSFYPRSWILPDEFQLFVAQVRMVKDGDPSWKPTFIVKPDGGCQGDGIYLIKDPSDIRLTGTLQSRPAVVQEYICKPLLIDKLKFDIRLYVLLKSLDPLEIYIAKDGLSRFCTEPYQEPNPQNLHHVFMHLTNYSLNIHSGKFIHSDSASTGSKRTFSSILCRLSSKGVDIKKVWSDIISLVIKTVIALTPELKVFYQSDIPTGRPGPTCFQILGFDILLMKNLKPVLLEVNANPSMRIEHEHELSPGVYENVPSLVDEEVKVAVIRDTLRLMDPLKKKRDTQSQHPLTGKEDPNSEIGDLDMDRESHLPSICLKQVFPKYAKQFNYLRLVDRMANLFIRFLGIKGTMKLGPTGFRTFIRNCKLSSSSLSMAAVDILYIDITRRWNSMTLDQRESGMCLQAFVEAFFFLAQRKFKMLPLHEQVASLIDLCEYHLSLLDEKRLVCGRNRPPQSSPPQEINSTIQPAAGSPQPRMTGANKLPHSKRALS